MTTYRLSESERELALRLEDELRSKHELTVKHLLQIAKPLSRRTRHCRLVKLRIADFEKGKYYEGVLLRRGPAWEAFEKTPEGRVLRNEEFVRGAVIEGLLRQWRSRTDTAPTKVRIKIRQAADGASPEKASKIILFRPRAQGVQQPRQD